MNIHDPSRMLRDTEGRKVGQMSRLPKLLFLQLARKSLFAERELCRGGITSLLLDFFFFHFLFFSFLLCAASRSKKKGEKKEELRLLTTSKVIHLKTPFSSEQRLIAS